MTVSFFKILRVTCTLFIILTSFRSFTITRALLLAVSGGIEPLKKDPSPIRSALETSSRTLKVEGNKTLVVIIGNLRGGELAWKSLYENVLDPNNADLALMIGDTIPQYLNSSLFRRANFHWTFPEFEDWGDALDLINGTAWRNSLVPIMHSHSTILGAVKAKRFAGSGAVIFMIRWFLARKLKELGMIDRYEKFILTRSDHFYLCKHDVRGLDNRQLWVPTGQNYKGITDRHLVVGSQHILAALDILPDLIAHPRDYETLLRRRSGNPEKLIKSVWKRHGLLEHVRTFDRLMFTCATIHDTTRWKKRNNELVPEGVYLKYSMEYNESVQTCSYRKGV